LNEYDNKPKKKSTTNKTSEVQAAIDKIELVKQDIMARPKTAFSPSPWVKSVNWQSAHTQEARIRKVPEFLIYNPTYEVVDKVPRQAFVLKEH
jgi:hypothetical protein